MGIDLFLYKNVGMIWKGEGIVFAGKKDAIGFIFCRFLAFSFVKFRKGFSVNIRVEGDRWPVEGIDIDRKFRCLFCFRERLCNGLRGEETGNGSGKEAPDGCHEEKDEAGLRAEKAAHTPL